ncbi:MORN repeat-containing protein 3 [Parambassis ranga]|uniref:MORN repeat-containing protein 3 n=1 Tax=Parambassis ranga TaxID=210632 RepID=A0A6P7JA08_9TELE|nr:MORN repeat-containing protein 3 [Parambassis ranga]
MPLVKAQHKRATLLDIKSQKCGLRHTVFSVCGDEYTGEWQNNKKHGRGIQLWKKSGAVYDGDWKFGKRDGHGTFSVLLPQSKTYAKKYCGEWKNGKKHGHGVFFYNHSAMYDGEWVEDQRSGWGRMHFENGDFYVGEWMNDKRHGRGIIRFSNGNWYEGTWQDGKKNGDGKFYYSDKGQLYVGVWKDGVAKCGTLSDCGRDKATTPPTYPIPKLHLMDAQLVLKEAKSAYLDNHSLTTGSAAGS